MTGHYTTPDDEMICIRGSGLAPWVWFSIEHFQMVAKHCLYSPAHIQGVPQSRKIVHKLLILVKSSRAKEDMLVKYIIDIYI